MAGLYEAIDAGVTSILDHAHHTWSHETASAGLDASIESGLRIFWAYDIHTISNGFTIPDQLADLKKIWEDGKWKGTATTIGVGFDEMSLHPKETVESVLNLAKCVHALRLRGTDLKSTWQRDRSKRIHRPLLGRALGRCVVESILNVTNPYTGAVDGLPQVLHNYGFLNGSIPIVFSHASWMSTSDASLLRETNQFISITPESEMHYGTLLTFAEARG